MENLVGKRVQFSYPLHGNYNSGKLVLHDVMVEKHNECIVMGIDKERKEKYRSFHTFKMENLRVVN